MNIMEAIGFQLTASNDLYALLPVTFYNQFKNTFKSIFNILIRFTAKLSS